LARPLVAVFLYLQFHVILQWNDFHTHVNLQTELAMFTGVLNIIDKNKIWKRSVFIINGGSGSLKLVASRFHVFIILCNLTGKGLPYEYEITILILSMYIYVRYREK